MEKYKTGIPNGYAHKGKLLLELVGKTNCRSANTTPAHTALRRPNHNVVAHLIDLKSRENWKSRENDCFTIA